jgi:hypothetical protein
MIRINFALCMLQAIRGGDHDFAIKEKNSPALCMNPNPSQIPNSLSAQIYDSQARVWGLT